MSRLRNRHCRPFLKAGRMLLRAYSLTVSGLRSRISATSVLFRIASSRSIVLTVRSCEKAEDYQPKTANTACYRSQAKCRKRSSLDSLRCCHSPALPLKTISLRLGRSLPAGYVCASRWRWEKLSNAGNTRWDPGVSLAALQRAVHCGDDLRHRHLAVQVRIDRRAAFRGSTTCWVIWILAQGDVHGVDQLVDSDFAVAVAIAGAVFVARKREPLREDAAVRSGEIGALVPRSHERVVRQRRNRGATRAGGNGNHELANGVALRIEGAALNLVAVDACDEPPDHKVCLRQTSHRHIEVQCGVQTWRQGLSLGIVAAELSRMVDV